LNKDNERFSRVRRMTDKDKQRDEFIDMADKKASKAIQVNTFYGDRTTGKNERAPSLTK